MGYFDNQGATATKATWANPEVVPDEKKQSGGWYYNPQSGNVDRWWSGDSGGGSNLNATGSVNAGAGVAATNAPAVPDLTSLYNTAVTNNPDYQNSAKEIEAVQNELTAKRQAYEQEKLNVNDNPYYSSATMTGKLNRVENKYRADETIANQKLSLAQAKQASIKADAEVKLNLAKGQYDLNNAAYKDTVSQYNKLLDSGAMVHASTQDIANMAVAIGMPTSMVQAVIDMQKASAVKPQLVTATDESGNQTVSVFDSNTGNLIKSTTLNGVAKGTTGSGTSTYGKTVDKYLPDALKVLDEIDASTNGKFDINTGKNVGDKLLSKAEFEQALRRIVGLVGNEETGKQLLNAAWESGGYNTWQW